MFHIEWQNVQAIDPIGYTKSGTNRIPRGANSIASKFMPFQAVSVSLCGSVTARWFVRRERVCVPHLAPAFVHHPTDSGRQKVCLVFYRS